MKSNIIVLITTLLFTISISAQVDVVDNKVGLNTLNPQHDIHMKGSELLFQDKSTLEIKMYMGTDGKLGIGTMAPTQQIDAHGNIAITHPLDGGQGDGTSDYGDIYSKLIFRSNDANNALSSDKAHAWIQAVHLRAGSNHLAADAGLQFVTTDPSNYGGAVRMTITNDGKVGIGTETPSRLLTLKKNNDGIRLESATSAAYSTELINQYNGGEQFYLRNNNNKVLGSKNIVAGQPGTETYLSNYYGVGIATGTQNPVESNVRMFIKQDGNVGIGTTDPNSKLEVVGKTKTTNLQVTTDAGAGKVLQSDADGNASWVESSSLAVTGDDMGNHTASQNINLNGKWLSGDGGNEGITVDDAGKVGIGTSQPEHQLHVISPSTELRTFNYGLENTVNTTGGWARSFRLRNVNDNNSAAFGSLHGNAYISAGFNAEQDPTGYTNIDMFISKIGNVGIGTISPDQKLTIQGGVNIGGTGNHSLRVRHLDGKAASGTGTDHLYLNYSNGKNVQVGGSQNSNLTVIGQTNTQTLKINTGAGQGKVLQSDATGNASWVAPSSLAVTGDDMGNHTATSDLNMGLNRILFQTRNTRIGLASGNDGTTGNYNNSIGYAAGNQLTTGNSNNFLGYSAGKFTTTGSANNFFGYRSGEKSTTASHNNMLGYLAGFENTTGNGNNFLGNQAGRLNKTGAHNTFIGQTAGYKNTTGSYNYYTGREAGRLNTTGNYNIAIGYKALYNNLNQHGNIALGYSTGYETTGGYNTLLGYNTGRGITTGTNNTIIGGRVTGLSPTLSNHIILADGEGNKRILVDETGNVGIGTTEPRGKLHIKSDWNATTGSSGLELEGDKPSIRFKSLMGANQDSEFLIHLGEAGQGGGLSFFNGTTGAWNHRMVIEEEGNVGIGTKTPDQKLTVQGDVNIGGTGNHRLRVRHVDGKQLDNTGFHDLYLNYGTGFDVNIGYGGQTSNLNVNGDIMSTNDIVATGFMKSNRPIFAQSGDDITKTPPTLNTNLAGWKLGMWGNSYYQGVASYTMAFKTGTWFSFFQSENPANNANATLVDSNSDIAISAQEQNIQFRERAAAITTPRTGFGGLYAKNDGNLYYKNDEGTESALTGMDSGALLQQKFAKTTASNRTISSATPITIDGLEISITPKRANSIIVVEAFTQGYMTHGSSTLTVYSDNTPTSAIKSGRTGSFNFYHFEPSNNTNSRTYSIKALSIYNLYLTGISYMTVKEVVGEEVISSYTTKPDDNIKNRFTSNQDSTMTPPLEFNDNAQSQLDAQLEMIEALKKELEDLKLGNSTNIDLVNQINVKLENAIEMESSYISQNIPNPTSNAATIKYYVPETSSDATVRFYSLSGQVMEEVDITKMGQGEIRVDLSNMISGNYMYALIVDGELIDTKTMVIVK